MKQDTTRNGFFLVGETRDGYRLLECHLIYLGGTTPHDPDNTYILEYPLIEIIGLILI